MNTTCRLCGKGAQEIGGYLTRVNEKGVPGIWECRPSCDADLPFETNLMLALESEPKEAKCAELEAELREWKNMSACEACEVDSVRQGLQDDMRGKCDALAMQVDKLREAVVHMCGTLTASFDCGYDGNLVSKALSLPDLSTDIIKRHDAEVLRGVVMAWKDGGFINPIPQDHIIALAEELDKS